MGVSKARALRDLVSSPKLEFLMECHNGLSAKIAEEAGFRGLWGSGLSISAACGVRDNNELSWTQVLDVLEYISDATSVPLLVDGDTGYGDFNNMRRLVAKLESRDVAGVCIEDKVFPKRNSFIEGGRQALAEVDEFCGKIKAGKDAQADDDFVIVARTEAFIAGRGLSEALERADAYRKAGADAILVHSKSSSADEVLSFVREWNGQSPVLIVPTMYYCTPTRVFADAGFSAVIWANHLMRSGIASMQRTASTIFSTQSLIYVEDEVVPVSEVFRLQGADELRRAEEKYLPKGDGTTALVLAASRGSKLGELTEDRPKTMLPISGKPILLRMTETLRSIGIDRISVVRGYRKDTVTLEDVDYVDNDLYAKTKEVYSLSLGIGDLAGSLLISYGDILFHRHVPRELLETTSDFAIAVDANWKESLNKDRYVDFVRCSAPASGYDFDQRVLLEKVLTSPPEDPSERIDGEWIGLMRVSPRGTGVLKRLLSGLDREALADMRMASLFGSLIEMGEQIEVKYCLGDWADVDELKDVISASTMISR